MMRETRRFGTWHAHCNRMTSKAALAADVVSARPQEETTMAKYGKKAQDKVKKAMHERKEGTLRSGRSGKKVTSRKQAIAIGLSEARSAGGKVPKKSAKKATKKSSGGRKTAKKTTKKSAAKKSTGRKSSTKKSATKKSTTKKSTRKKSAAKKGSARKKSTKRSSRSSKKSSE
jgi:hypothetical protein